MRTNKSYWENIDTYNKTMATFLLFVQVGKDSTHNGWKIVKMWVPPVMFVGL